ncbi:MAG TPA: bifunctional DNA-formamidopyrimidine glycosylase/DNA-(apurinic or apyrimidinic site) lyase [Pyrinomonadaceae bacterium]|nr:bifunctional DNA-formamidopyrimidine glycosylase/DNA-(apurinic or apyrimidinic site) lyase [Pyrinomonadaceae bacterium]
MPELPEVEIVVQCLHRLLPGRTIVSAELRRPRLTPGLTQRSFESRLRNSRIFSVRRRGKFILFELEKKWTVITHLRMSGRFMLLDQAQNDPKFAHAVFHLDGDERLIFRDQRHFGMMKIVETAKLFETKDLAKLAPEPFSHEFSLEYLSGILKISKRNIKQLLLDQTKVCGVGNIYASEALFLARINPHKFGNEVSRKKAAALRDAIREVMNETLQMGTNLEIDRENIGGGIYGASTDVDWHVYGREGKPCQSCGKPIVRTVQNGRSTYFCRVCQRK